jgi:uncharacterized protein (UPF0218 family)
LIKGQFKYTTKILEKIINKKKPKKIISVGDRVSKSMLDQGISIDIVVFDCKEMRVSVLPPVLKTDKKYKIKNNAGSITDDAWNIMKEAVELDSKVSIQVEGEEDLLTIVAVLSAPIGSIVIYGQPNEGLVVVDVSKSTKNWCKEIISRMKSQK